MDWTCSICKQPNLGEHKDCVNCGCPVSATAQEIDALRNEYTGEVFSEEEKVLEAGAGESFSPAWWNAQVDRSTSTALHFWVWFLIGGFTGLVGAISSKSSHTLLSIVAGGFGMGCLFAFRCFVYFSEAGYGGTRKKVVLTNVLLAAAVFIFSLWRSE